MLFNENQNPQTSLSSTTWVDSLSTINICPEHLTVRIDNNLFAASYEGGFQTFQTVQQQKSLTGLIFSNYYI